MLANMIDNILHYMLRGEELYHAILLGGIRNAIPK